MSKVLIYRLCGGAGTGGVTSIAEWDTTAREAVYRTIGATGLCTNYYIENDSLLDTWCEGSTRVEIRSRGSLGARPSTPPWRRIDTPNSASCAISNPCNLKIEGVDVELTGTDAEGNDLFRATVRATGNGTIRYSLTQGILSYKTSNIFNNLQAGSFTAYANSAVISGNLGSIQTCIDSYKFDIKPRRRVKFFHEFRNEDEQVCRVEWLDYTHTGEPIELKGAADGVTITYRAVGNKIDVLHGSELSANVIIQDYTTLTKFYTPNDRQYRVDYYEAEVLVWQGYHLPDLYLEPWVATPYVASLIASDGIGSLQDIGYADGNGNRFYGRARAVDVLMNCLNKLDLTIPLYLAINVFESTMDTALEPLAQCEVDQSNYYNKDGYPDSCKDVLEKLLTPFLGFVKQSAGALHVLRFPELKGSYTRRKSALGGAYTGFELEETFEDITTIHRYGKEENAASFRNAAQVREARQAVRRVAVTTEWGAYENFIRNGEFQDWNHEGTIPFFWDVIGEGVEQQTSPDMRKFELAFTEFGENYIRSQPVDDLVSSEKAGFTVTFDYEATISDIIEREDQRWETYPEFALSVYGDRIYNIISLTNNPIALFGTTEVNFAPSEANTFNFSFPPSLTTRTNAIVAYADGTMAFLPGEDVEPNTRQVPAIPANALLAIFFRYDTKTQSFVFGSFHEDIILRQQIGVQIGDYRVTEVPARPGRRIIGNNYAWSNTASGATIAISTEGAITSDGSEMTFKGKAELTLPPLSVAGVAQLIIHSPSFAHNNSYEGVFFYMDNVVFQERKLSEIEREINYGDNPVDVRTEPLEVTLFHGSSIPRTEALITLLDSTPAKIYEEGYTLQEKCLRELMQQHSRETYVLRGDVVGNVTPISIVREFNMLSKRFAVDGWAKNCHTGIISIEAQEVFGGAGTPIPDRAILHEDGTPMMTEHQDFFILE